MSLNPDNRPVDSPADFGKGPEGTAKRWIAEIQHAEKECIKWWSQARKIERRYRDERDTISQTETRFNVLWSNVQTLLPACYARPPQPVVGRRFRDSDPIARAASVILQRNLMEGIEATELHGTIKQIVLDYLLAGRGQIWVRYEPKFITPERPAMAAPASDMGVATPDDDGVQVTDDGAEADEVVGWETVDVDYVHWEDFLHSPARTWKEVRWVGRVVRMTEAEGLARFGPVFKDVALDWKPTNMPEGEELGPEHETFKRARVVEIWNIEDRKVYWVSPSYKDKVLDVRDDPLKLADFFPCPKPLSATTTNSTLIPVPDYVEYQDQAAELDELTQRISLVSKAVKVAGTYDASQPALGRIFNEGVENELIPVDDWRAFAAKGGLEGSVDLLPLQEIMETLQALAEVRQAVKSDLYEETGIADVIRGATAPEETATAQRIKGRYATMRLSDRQMEVARFVRDVLRLMAEVMCHHFSPQTLVLASNFNESEFAKDQAIPPQAPMQPPHPGVVAPPAVPNQPILPQAIALLKNDKLRGFRVDVEDQSTIAADDQAEKASRNEFLASVGQFLQQSLQIPPQMAPALAPMLGKMLLFGVRAYRAGAEMETAIEDAISKLQAMASQPQQPPPDPKMIVAGAQARNLDAKTQMMGAEMQQKQQEMRMQAQTQANQDRMDMQQHGIDVGRLQLEGHDQQMEAAKLDSDNRNAERQHALDLIRLQIESKKLDIEHQRMLHDTALGHADLQLKHNQMQHDQSIGRADLQLRTNEFEHEKKHPAPVARR